MHLTQRRELQIGDFYASETEVGFCVEFDRVEFDRVSDDSGFYTEVSATFDYLVIGLMTFRRADLVKMIGEAEVAGMERDAAEYFGERASEYAKAA